MTNEVAERYAQGLFELARENGTIETKKEQSQLLAELLASDPDIMTFLRAVKITRDEKKAFIETAFSSFADADMIRFLKLLTDKSRISALSAILRQFLQKCNEELGIETASVLSARKLKEEDLERIRKALEHKTGKKIIIRNEINPDLIAGIKVVIGNNVTDVTMKHQIESMKESLLKGGRA